MTWKILGCIPWAMGGRPHVPFACLKLWLLFYYNYSHPLYSQNVQVWTINSKRDSPSMKGRKQEDGILTPVE